MNRVITINLNGNAYQLEESGFDALRAYLDQAARRLEGNPDKDEIMADIEQAIADKFRAVLGPNKTVVITREVEGALTAMGPVQDANATDAEPASASATSRDEGAKHAHPDGAGAASAGAGSAKRLFTIPEGAMLLGVCNGLAAYLNLDVTIVRLLFVILSFFWGAGILCYLVMAVIIPTAATPADKAAAYGTAATAQEFIRRAKAGYYEGMKKFQDKHARREWRRKFKQQTREWQRASGYHWYQNPYHWKHQWVNPVNYGAGFGMALFGLMNAAVALLGIYAIYSLVKSGAVFGLLLPAGVPLWIGIIAVIVIWQVVLWPIKVLTWGASLQSGHPVPLTGPLGGLGNFIFGVCFLVLMIWVADRSFPEVHEALKQVPPYLHRAVDAVQQWLERK